MQCDRGLEVFQFLGKSIRQSHEASAVHSQSMILFFDVTCGNQIDNWTATHRNPFHVYHVRRRASALFLKITVAKGFDGFPVWKLRFARFECRLLPGGPTGLLATQSESLRAGK